MKENTVMDVNRSHKKQPSVYGVGERESEAWIVRRGPPSVRGDLAPSLSPSRLSSHLGLNLDIGRLQAGVHARVRGGLLVDRPILELE